MKVLAVGAQVIEQFELRPVDALAEPRCFAEESHVRAARSNFSSVIPHEWRN
jgi:hypothetical protein